MTCLGATVARQVLDPVLAVVFPSTCPGCQAMLDHPTRGPLCASCWSNLPRHIQPLCACGGPCGAAGPCGRCRRNLSPIRYGASLGPYAGTLRQLIHDLKYRGQRRVATRLAEILLSREEVGRLLEPRVALVAVPLHPRRRRERGFNQAELLAEALGRRARVDLLRGVLVRRRQTQSQTGLSAARRRANVIGAFAVRRPETVAGRRLVLVDDVVTTGATALACARALLGAGAKDVRLLAAARVL